MQLISVADPELTVLVQYLIALATFFFFFFQWCTGSLCPISKNERGKGVCTSLSYNGSAAAESHVNPSVNIFGLRSQNREQSRIFGATYILTVHVNYSQIRKPYNKMYLLHP